MSIKPEQNTRGNGAIIHLMQQPAAIDALVHVLAAVAAAERAPALVPSHIVTET
jgi:hypothetical protein